MSDRKQRFIWQQFSMSNLLLLVALMAVSIGWWCDRSQLDNELRATSLQLDKMEKQKAIFTIIAEDGKQAKEELEQLRALVFPGASDAVANP